ncbi:uncharacterized protein [Miscanthus floridulus]|uniref:uncharacterized protein n=1 Tax=Miscanthus floridulus TaxID=154761 RepID=UPI00345AD232
MLSFLLQVMLLVLAEFRRRIDSGVLRFFIWSAYMLADATAIYVLGHISVTSTTSSPEQELTAFWAPFLLLHLGGQDNITAYTIEDNQLWLRHLQTFTVQVVAAAYVLYGEWSYIVGSRWSLLLPANIIMFAVGVLKYGERVWTLKCAGTISSSSNYRHMDRIPAFAFGISSGSQSHWDQDTEAFLLKAHILLDAPMDLLMGPSAFLNVHYGTSGITGEDLYKVAEMQISLMHDVLYTKAKVMHTWYGLCIHMVSSLGTLAALLLFHLLGKIHKGHYSRVDMTITYILLVGAVVMEITSSLRAMFSSWTCALLDQRAQERNMWHCLYWIVSSLRRLVHAAEWRRYWSGSMGQHNLLQLCARSTTSKCSMIARWMGVEDPWNTMVYLSSIPVPPHIKQLLVEGALKSEGVSDSSPSHIRNSRGRAALENRGLCEGLLAWSIDIELDESIVVWHIVTDLYLCWFKKQAKSSGRQDDTELLDLAKVIEAVEALSNYMMFLLAARPYMLPPPTSRNAYVHVCYSLTSVKCRTPEDVANLVQLSGHELNTRSNIEHNDAATSTSSFADSSRYKKILDKGSQLGAKLIDDKFEGLGTPEILDLISQVWMEMLCYVSYRCSAHSHAKQLSNGGELITVAAFLMEHIRRRTSMP